ncbi:MAG: FlgD immunoglobulin-like domain containing protein [bacterium]
MSRRPEYRTLAIPLLTFAILCWLNIAAAQTAIVYVDANNGSDLNSGTNPTNTPTGTGPKATLQAALSTVVQNGKIVVFAGIYAGDGVDTDASPVNPADNADIEISSQKYPNLSTGLTIELRSLGTNKEIKILAEPNSVTATNGALLDHTADAYIPQLIVDIPAATLTITSMSGEEYLNLAAQHSNGSVTSGIILRGGIIQLNTSSLVRLRSGSTIEINGTARFGSEAPQKGIDLSLLYKGSASITAGPESRYGDYGKGTLVIDKIPETTITFPAAMSFAGNAVPVTASAPMAGVKAITVRSGNVVFEKKIAAGTFSSIASVADVQNASSNEVSFKDTLLLIAGALATAGDASISTIENTGIGSLRFAGPVVWLASPDAVGKPLSELSFGSGQGVSLVRNTSSGSINFSSTVQLSAASITAPSGDAYYSVLMENIFAGSLVFSKGISAPVTRGSNSGFRSFTVHIVNTSSGSISVSGTLRGKLLNSGEAGGVISLNGSTTVSLPITNAPGKIINLGAWDLTVLPVRDAPFLNDGSGNQTSPAIFNHRTKGSTIQATSGKLIFAHRDGSMTLDGGTISNLFLNSDGGVTICNTENCNIGRLSMQAGELVLEVPCAVSDSIYIMNGLLRVPDGVTLKTLHYTQSGGMTLLGTSSGSTLRIDGNFLRLDGTIQMALASVVLLQGSVPQTMDGGTNLQLTNLAIANTASAVTIQHSLQVAGQFSLSTGSQLHLKGSSIVLNANGVKAIINGQYSSESAGGIIFGGASLLPGFQPIANAVLESSSNGLCSNLTIDVGTTNSVTVLGHTRFSGVLNLFTGSLNVPSSIIEPAGSQARITRNLALSNGIVLSGGLFNTGRQSFDIEYLGSLSAAAAIGSEFLSEPGLVRTLTLNVNSDTRDNDGNLATGSLAYLDLPASGLVFQGALSIGPLAAVRFASNGLNGNVVELRASDVTHQIRGMLFTADVGDYFLVSGAQVNILGSEFTRDAALLGNIIIASQNICSIKYIQGFMGSFRTVPSSITVLRMGSRDASGVVLASEQTIFGSLNIGGALLTLASAVYAMGGVEFSSGLLNFTSYDLVIAGAGGFAQGSNTQGFLSAGGSLVIAQPQTSIQLSNVVETALLNLTILAPTRLSSDARIIGRLTIGSKDSIGIPSLSLNAFNLTMSGSAIALLDKGALAGNKIAIVSNNTPGVGGGRLILTGFRTGIEVANDYSIEELLLDPINPQSIFTLESLTADIHTLHVTDIFTQSGGEFSLGANNLSLDGVGSGVGLRAFNRNGGSISSTTGIFLLAGHAQQYIDPGPDFRISQLRIDNPAGVKSEALNQKINITRSLDLSRGILAVPAGTLLLADNATVIRRRTDAKISTAPLFEGRINLLYLVDSANGNLITERELPASFSILKDLVISNPNQSADRDNVTLDKDVVIVGTLYLMDGELDEGSNNLTLAENSRLSIGRGRFESSFGAQDAPTVSRYYLRYCSGTSLTSSDKELQSGPGKTILSLEVVNDTLGNATRVTLHRECTVRDLRLNCTGGGIALGVPGSFAPQPLHIQGTLTIEAGSFINPTGSATTIDLQGNQEQLIQVPSQGLVLPGGSSAIHLRLNNRLGFRLSGGDLKLDPGSLLYFINGILRADTTSITLSQQASQQGFDRTGIVGANVSHILGRVRQSISVGAGNPLQWANGKYEFPVGSVTGYQPFIMTFTAAYPATANPTIEVQAVVGSAEGTVGLPFDAGNGIRIGSYGLRYWSLQSTLPTLSQSQQCDIEVQTIKSDQAFSRIVDLRLIRRQESNLLATPWQLQGSGLSYGRNALEVSSTGDTLLIVRSTGSLANLIPEGTRFTIGYPTRPPLFLQALRDTVIRENDTLIYKFSTDPRDYGEEILYALLNPPTGVSIDEKNGILRWVPTFLQAGSYSIIVTASDGQFTITNSSAISVQNVNRTPRFARILRDTTLRAGQDSLLFTYLAFDADGDPLIFNLLNAPPGCSLTNEGRIRWIPLLSQAGGRYTITVRISDGSASDSTTASVTIIQNRRPGDVSGDDVITAYDASLILLHVAGIQLLSGPLTLFLADVSKDGTITAYDASLILQYVAGVISVFPVQPAPEHPRLMKQGERTGSLGWGVQRRINQTSLIEIPLILQTDGEKIYSVQMKGNWDSTIVGIRTIAGTLPKDWQLCHEIKGETITIVMAGASPLEKGSIAQFTLERLNPTVSLELEFEAMLNERVIEKIQYEAVAIHHHFALMQNYPNPFNPSTMIQFQLPVSGHVKLQIFDISGRLIKTLKNSELEAGEQRVQWDGRTETGEAASSGIYLYCLETSGYRASKRMLLIR